MKRKSKSSRHLGFAIAVASAVIFGIWPAAIRGIYANGGNVVFAVLLTTWVRGIGMALYCLVKKQPLFEKRAETRQAIIGGFFQAVCLVTLYASLLFLPGPVAIIILFTHTLMLLFYMAWQKEIKLDRYTVLTTLIALGGLTLVLDLWQTRSFNNVWGIILAFLGAVTTAGRLYVFGRQVKKSHPITVGAENFLIAALFLTICLYFATPHLPTTITGWEYALLGSTALTIGTYAMFYGIALLGSFRWSLFLKLEPVFTSLFSALFLNEILKPHQYAGIAIVVGSLALYQIVDHRRKIAL